MSKDQSSEKVVVVRDVPEHTRMKVRIYAAARNIPRGQALAEMVGKEGPAPEYMALVACVGRLATEVMRVADNQAGNEPEGPWVVKDVPLDAHRAVKVHSVLNDTTMAGALEQMIDNFLQQGTMDQHNADDAL